jgi:hypothetical protein
MWRSLLPVSVCLALAGCGRGDDGQPDAARAAITPFPTVDFAELEPGTTYTTKVFQPSLEMTLPAGAWSGSDVRDHVEIEPETEPPVADAGVGFHHMTRVFDPARGGRIPGDAVPGPDDFAAWLRDHPHLRATAPEPVEALGLKGVSIEVRVKSSQPERYQDCGKYEGDCVVMYVGAIEPVVYGEKVKGRFLILDQADGKQLVVEEFVEPASAFDAEIARLDAALAKTKLAG